MLGIKVIVCVNTCAEIYVIEYVSVTKRKKMVLYGEFTF